MAKKAVSTIGTILKFGKAETALAKLCAIKSYPDLGGAPDQLETTDLEDSSQTFVDGVISMDSMEFTANYSKDDYKALLDNEREDGYFQLEFGEDGKDGCFAWQGTYSVSVSGGDVNAVREMTITVTPSTEISLVA